MLTEELAKFTWDQQSPKISSRRSPPVSASATSSWCFKGSDFRQMRNFARVSSSYMWGFRRSNLIGVTNLQGLETIMRHLSACDKRLLSSEKYFFIVADDKFLFSITLVFFLLLLLFSFLFLTLYSFFNLLFAHSLFLHIFDFLLTVSTSVYFQRTGSL